MPISAGLCLPHQMEAESENLLCFALRQKNDPLFTLQTARKRPCWGDADLSRNKDAVAELECMR